MNENETPVTETPTEIPADATNNGELVLPADAVTIPYIPAGTKQAGVKRLLASLAQAISAGNISARQAAELRRQFGISKAYFTKKRATRAKKRVRARMAKVSRRKNRGTGKGEKRNGGRLIITRT